MKQATKEKRIEKKRKLTSVSSESDNNASKVIRTLLIVLVVFFAVYFVTAIITGEIKFGSKKRVETPAEIQYQEILLGESFTKGTDGYYVLYMNFTDPETQTFMSYSDLYGKKDKALNVYYVDMEKGFNKGYNAGEENSNSKANSVNELKIKAPTLVKFEKGKIVQYIEESDAIKNVFKELIK